MNKYLLLLISLSFIIFINCNEEYEMLNIDDFEWKNRVLVIGGGGSKYKSQLEKINNISNEFTERDLVLVLLENDLSKISYDGLKTYKKLDYDSSINLRKKYNFKDFKLILIGKDGGEKYNSVEPVEINTIFEIIDEMPMRKREIKERN